MTLIEVLKYGYFGRIESDSQDVRIIVWMCIACAAIGYLLGSINWGVILSRKYGGDVRNYGSGNAGATNMMRTYGKKAGAKTFLLDFLKATVASFLCRILLGIVGAYIGGFFCIVGHAYPIFFKFKGGKGVVTTVALCFWTDWRVFLIMFVIYFIILFGYKMVSLASCMVAALYPLVLYALAGPSIGALISFFAGAFVIYLHRTNIRRIIDHTESKLDFHKKEKKKTEDRSSDGEE